MAIKLSFRALIALMILSVILYLSIRLFFDLENNSKKYGGIFVNTERVEKWIFI